MNRAAKAALTTLVTTVGFAGTAAALTGPLADGVAIGVTALVFAGLGLLYGLEAGILECYALDRGKGWIELLVDVTWSLPNTVFGFVLGNLVYVFFADPSHTDSRDAGVVVFKPRSPDGFGNDVLQTLGTINIGGRGQHEMMHVLQARAFGPLYLPVYAVNYVVNFLAQGLWTISVGLLLWRLGNRDQPYFVPDGESVVGGFFGWIYYNTVFERWAYASGNP